MLTDKVQAAFADFFEFARGTYEEQGLLPPRRSRSATWVPTVPPPRLVKGAEAAEQYAAEFMRCLGFEDARATPPGTDGGIDIDCSLAVAQVKMEGRPTGRPAVQALAGVATVEKKAGIFFSLTSYTAEALSWAVRANLAAFEFEHDGHVSARTPLAQALLTRGASSLDENGK